MVGRSPRAPTSQAKWLESSSRLEKVLQYAGGRMVAKRESRLLPGHDLTELLGKCDDDALRSADVG
jgi:hypothetical protein